MHPSTIDVDSYKYFGGDSPLLSCVKALGRWLDNIDHQSAGQVAIGMITTRAESRLRMLAQNAIDSGVLPDVEPHGILGGPGTGGHCSLCGKQICDDEIEYEFSLPWGIGVRTFRFHLACELAWSLVCIEKQIHSCDRCDERFPNDLSGATSGFAMTSKI